MSVRRRLLMLAPYGETSASTRFRMLSLIPHLAEHGIDVEVSTFLDAKSARGFYEPGNAHRKAQAVLRGSLRQLSAATRRADAIFVQREVALLGPPVVEWLFGVARRLPIYLDVDDAVWLDVSKSSRHPRLSRLLRNPEKSWFSIRRARWIFAGSHYLADACRNVNASVSVAPSVVSKRHWRPRTDAVPFDPPVIGWIGTHTTAPQLVLAASALRRLREEGHRFTLRIVGAGSDFSLPGLAAELRPWTPERDVADFQDIDIGLAPMWDDEWGAGKCAFKQIQYMAVGVPYVSSWVGAAREIVRHEHNGLVATTSEEWYRHLRALLESRDLRSRLAENGRSLIEKELCLEVQGPRVARVIAETLTGLPPRSETPAIAERVNREEAVR